MTTLQVRLMDPVLDRYILGDISINDVVSHLSSGSDLRDVLALIEEEKYRASALYILAEVPSSVSRPVWRHALSYVGDADEQVAFYAIDIVHTFLSEVAPSEFLIVLLSADFHSPVVFKKLFAVVLSADRNLLEEVSMLAEKRQVSAEHRWGITLLLNDQPASELEIEDALRGNSLVKRFYASSAVGRYYRENLKLLSLLPESIQRRLEIYNDTATRVIRNGSEAQS